jgi:ABC-2 type transport system permease protein
MSTATVERAHPAAAPAVQVGTVTQARVLTSEWIKLRSLRSTGLTLLAAVVAMTGFGWIICAATLSRWSRMPPGRLAGFNPIDTSLSGFRLAQLAVGVLGVLLVTGEYATGMIRATLGAVPRRLPVLWAKTGLYAVVTFVLLLVASFAAFVGGQHFLGTHGTTLSATGAVRGVIGAAGYLTLIGMFAVALGFIIRSTAGGIATLFGLLLVAPGLGELLPSDWQPHILPYLPSNAGESIFAAHPDSSLLSSGAGLAVLVTWVVVALAAAAVLLTRRDA